MTASELFHDDRCALSRNKIGDTLSGIAGLCYTAESARRGIRLAANLGHFPRRACAWHREI